MDDDFDHDTFKVQTIKIGKNELERITNSNKIISPSERPLNSRIWRMNGEYSMKDNSSRSNESKQKKATQKEEHKKFGGNSIWNSFQFAQSFDSQENNIDIFQETARFGNSFTVTESKQKIQKFNKNIQLSNDKLFNDRLPPLQDLSRQPIKLNKQLNQQKQQQQTLGIQTYPIQQQRNNYPIDPVQYSPKNVEPNLLKTITIKYSNSLKYLQNHNSCKPQTSPDQTNNCYRSRQQDQYPQRYIKSVKESRASSSEQRRIKVLPIRLQGGGLFDSPIDQNKDSSLPRTNRFDIKKNYL